MPRKIKNFEELATTAARRVALEIAEAGYEAIDTARIIRETVSLEGETLTVDGEEIKLESVGRLIVAGIGKCAAEAAVELENILGDRISDGIIIAVGDHHAPLKKIKLLEGTHPYPSKQNMEASKKLLDLFKDTKENDLVIFLVTGGGSTLLCLPEDGNYARESLIFGAFMKSGAPIQDLNTVRKHMSKVRAGFLAEAMYPARVVSLIFNDVPGSDDIGFIASGPTVKDTTTVEDAERILDKYAILKACSLDGCGLVETPKEDKYFERVKNVVVVSNKTALLAMKEAAEEKGYKATVLDFKISGEARDVGRELAEKINAAPKKQVYLWGGETTVTVRKSGKGGRNQELVIGALMAIDDDALLMALSSDGRDNSDIGGVFCDRMIKDVAHEKGIVPQKALDENQSYDFSKEVENWLDTGDTGSNVSDLIIGIKD